MVQQRTGVQHPETFKNRLPKEAVQFKEVAYNPSPESYDRELFLQRVEQAETASNIQKWLSSKICGKAC
jgi:hypothetical protein